MKYQLNQVILTEIIINEIVIRKNFNSSDRLI